MKRYLDVTQEAGAAFFRRGIEGEVVMLNLLRFREVADYADFPELAPAEPISGRAAYELYMAHTAPFLAASGGEVLFLGEGGQLLIGPSEAVWDMVLLVKQRSVADFMAFANDEAYLAGMGHRTAALLDSRLLPMVALSD
ncbi:MAG TPA: DUF1330 domain-containing protein [Anaerolineae bacterium]|nr:DUF1330 domain-containing protein [Anaerolineae bacterium]